MTDTLVTLTVDAYMLLAPTVRAEVDAWLRDHGWQPEEVHTVHYHRSENPEVIIGWYYTPLRVTNGKIDGQNSVITAMRPFPLLREVHR